MRLSAILDQMIGTSQYEIRNEREFVYLGITDHDLAEATCTFLDNAKFIKSIKGNVAMVLTTRELAEEVEQHCGDKAGICIVENPRILYFRIHNYLSGNKDYIRSRSKTLFGEGCTISSLASIAEENVVIGNNVVIEEFVVIRENTTIGDNVIIRSGVKIGGQGYEFKHYEDSILSVDHLGGVVIGDNVEIQYNSCIDRGVYPWDDTVIGANSKVDNLVHIAHGVKLAENVMVVAQVGIGGRTVIGPETWIGFHSVVTNGVEIGKNARVNIGAVATKSVPDDGSVTGNFAIEHRKFIEHIKSISK